MVYFVFKNITTLYATHLVNFNFKTGGGFKSMPEGRGASARVNHHNPPTQAPNANPSLASTVRAHATMLRKCVRCGCVAKRPEKATRGDSHTAAAMFFSRVE